MSKTNNNKYPLPVILLTAIILIGFGYSFALSSQTTTPQIETNPPALAGGIMDEKTTIPTEEITALKADLEKSKKDLEDLKLKTDELEKKN